jgi:type I restriction enzyme S subunit
MTDSDRRLNAATQRRSDTEAEKVSAWKETEIGLLPAEWKVVELREIADCQGGYAFSPDYQGKSSGDYPFYKVSDMNLPGNEMQLDRANNYITEQDAEEMRVKTFQSGSVVFPKVGGAVRTNKKRILCQESVVDNNVMAVWVKEPSECLDEHLFYFFLTVDLNSLANPGTLPYITNSRVEKQLVPRPPLDEQRRIASALRNIQEAIAAQDDVITAARELKRSLMERLFTYGVTQSRGDAEAQRVQLKETEIGEVPEHWQVLPLDEVLESTQYGTSERADLSGRYPVLRMNNLEDGRIDNSDLKYMDLDDEDLKKYRLQPGDVIFNRTNSFELVGKTALFDLEGDYVFASYLIRVVPEATRLMSEYLNYYLNWQRTQRYLRQVATRGASQSNISATKLGRLKMALPNIREQRRSVEVLQDVDAKVAAEEQRKAALEELFRSALEQLMTGQIRLNAETQRRRGAEK